MTTRYAGKYRRSPYPQATRVKKRLPSYGTYHWEGGILASPQDTFSFFAGGTIIFTGGTSPPYFTHIRWVLT